MEPAERLSSYERDINRLYLICELLLVYLLKTEMRKQITPKILKMHKRSASVVRLLTLDRRETELEQFILKNRNSELSLIEIDTKTNAIKNVFFLKIAHGSRRFSFGVYKDRSDSLSAVNELENLITNVLANLRNEPLIKQISHKFDHFAINHIKGDQDFTVDSYDKELLNLEFVVSDIYLQQGSQVRRSSNDPAGNRLPVGKSDVQDSRNPDGQPNEASNASRQRQSLVESQDSGADRYGIDRNSIPPEVYANFERKLTELLSNVYLNEQNSWQFSEESHGLKLWTQNHPSYVILRSEIMMPYPIELVREHVCDPNFRLSYDSLLKSFEVLKKYTDDVALVRAVLKGNMLLSDRDFITCRVAFYQNKDVRSTHSDVHLHELHARVLQAPRNERRSPRRAQSAGNDLDTSRRNAHFVCPLL